MAAASPKSSHRDTWNSGGLPLVRRRPPRTRATAPPTPNIPPLGTKISSPNRMNAKRIRATPAQLKGRTLRAKNPRIRAMTPNTPGNITPGLSSSTKMARVPNDSSKRAMLGSAMISRNRSMRFMSLNTTSESAVWRVTSRPECRVTSRPSTASSRSSRSSASRSTTFSCNAWLSLADSASRTALSAQSPLRPLSSASLLIWAAASLVTLSARGP